MTILLETLVDFAVHVFSVPFYKPILRFVLGLLRGPGGRRLRARGKKVFHRELARVSTGMSVWVWAELVFADPVTFGSPILVSFFLVEEIPFGWFGQKISHYEMW